jgi:hypothetical protein
MSESVLSVTRVRARPAGVLGGVESFLGKPERAASSSSEDQERAVAPPAPMTSAIPVTRARATCLRGALSVDGALHTTPPCFGKWPAPITPEWGIHR